MPAVDQRYSGQLHVRKVWWNPRDPAMAELSALAQAQGVKSSPWFIVYRDGQPIRSGYAFPDETGDGMQDLLRGIVTEPES